MSHRRSIGLGALVILACACAQVTASEVRVAALTDLSLEQLGEIEVTSVSRSPERVLDAPASIFVITDVDIRRSGALTLPEALRLAPNLQVARIDASQYAISSRGFNNAIGNKLLVLVDGRTIYTPLFSGVFWDQQDVMLEDIERIEVISGPGATLWGANAVNGVINVITKAAARTQGAYAAIDGGNQGSGAAFRFGGTLGPGAHYRVYGKTGTVDNTRTALGARIRDSWRRVQVGFRADWTAADGAMTVQGDAYSGRSEDRGAPAGAISVGGANLLARWSRKLQGGSDIKVQAYYDRSDRSEPVLFHPDAEILDVEFQHAVPLGNHRLLWGGGYRYARDLIKPGILFAIYPRSRAMNWKNVFVQDAIQLGEKVELTVGLKLEENRYTGIESLPSTRLAWNISPDRMLWAAASRAVRAPARLDREIFVLPNPPFIIAGGPDFQSEVAKVLEVGLRERVSPKLTYSATLFWTRWDKLRSGQPPLNAQVQNMINGTAYGIEAWGAFQAASNWRLNAGITTLRKDLKLLPGSTDPVGPRELGNDPEYQALLRSSLNISSNSELDISLRRVGALPDPRVPAYTAVDLRFALRLTPALEVSVAAQNLFDPGHAEFNAAPGRSEFERGIFLRMRWSP